MAMASKARNRPLSSPANARCRPTNTSSPKTSRRCDSTTEADSFDLVGCIHDAALEPDLWSAVLERVVGAVGGPPGIVQARGQKTIGLVGEGGGVRWLS